MPVSAGSGAALYQRLRGGLYRRLPLLALPLGLLDWQPASESGTDGAFFYAPEALLASPEQAGMVLLHSVLHAMLGHPWQRGRREAGLWSLACDISAELLSRRLLSLPMDGVAGQVYYALQAERAFSAAAVCDALQEPDFPLPPDALRAAFARDSHSFWTASSPACSRAAAEGGDSLSALWQRQKEKLRPYLLPERPKIGAGTAGQRLELPQLPENHTRFAALLRAFSAVQENRHVTGDDFSYAWYLSGLRLCGTPLFEELEYTEERRLSELAIVLDTSASCSRGLTAWFLSAVHAILCTQRLFFERFRLYILQCDCALQQDTLLTTLDEFQWYLEHLELYGGGGTDFRPAFRHIDRLVESGELPRLGGVLYFTDGYGVFPERAPDYPVAFVMLEHRYDDINIPPWARTLVLQADKPGRDEGWI